VFKRVFGDRNDTQALGDLLSAIMKIPRKSFEQIQILDSFLNRTKKNEKLCILDINARMTDGTEINIELQLISKKNFIQRVIYYLGKRIVSQLGRGHDYEELKPVVSINIVDYPMFPQDEDYHHTFHLRKEHTGTKLTDLIRIDFLELPKAALHKGEDEMEQFWMDFFNSETEEDMNLLARRKPEIFEHPVATVRYMSLGKSIQYHYDRWMMAKYDRKYELEFAHDEGLDEGVARGIEQGVAQGIEQGVAQGIEQGVAQGIEQTFTLLKLLAADNRPEDAIRCRTDLAFYHALCLEYHI
jgi:predicted transposase/invertase (TIGR01784 family)